MPLRQKHHWVTAITTTPLPDAPETKTLPGYTGITTTPSPDAPKTKTPSGDSGKIATLPDASETKTPPVDSGITTTPLPDASETMTPTGITDIPTTPLPGSPETNWTLEDIDLPSTSQPSAMETKTNLCDTSLPFTTLPTDSVEVSAGNFEREPMYTPDIAPLHQVKISQKQRRELGSIEMAHRSFPEDQKDVTRNIVDAYLKGLPPSSMVSGEFLWEYAFGAVLQEKLPVPRNEAAKLYIRKQMAPAKETKPMPDVFNMAPAKETKPMPDVFNMAPVSTHVADDPTPKWSAMPRRAIKWPWKFSPAKALSKTKEGKNQNFLWRLRKALCKEIW